MSKTILQIPIDKELRDQATLAATRLGFSSVQEPIRVFLKQLASRKLRVTFEPEVIHLSPKAIKRYDRITKDIESGKAELFTAQSVDELMHHLENS